MVSATITGLGMAVPAKMRDNKYFDQRYGTDLSSFLESKRGIYQRYHLSEDQSTSDLIIPAAQEALKNAGISAAQVDMIIVATDTPDYVSPPTAVRVAHALGCKRAAFDVNAACAGFVFALDMAGKYISSDSGYRNVLVVGAYAMSKFFDWQDYKVTSVFADGAGAAVLSATSEENTGIQGSVLASDGSFFDAMGIYGGGADAPETKPTLEFRRRVPPEMNVELWPQLVRTALDRAHSQVSDVSLAVFTQINRDAIFATAAELELPADKCHTIMDRYGYTGSACIPMALYDAQNKGLLNERDLVVLCGSGGGINMGAIALRWGASHG